MPLSIDHLIYAAADLDAAVDDIERRLGVRAAGGGRHLGLGTHNRLLGLGPRTYLEIIAPDPEQPPPTAPLPFGAEGVAEGRFAGWALTCDDIEAAVGRARRHGFDPGGVLEMQRETDDGRTLRWRLTENALTAGVVPFLISWDGTEHPARSAPGGLHLESFHVEHPDPDAVATALAALDSDVEVRPAERPALVAHIAGPAGVHEVR